MANRFSVEVKGKPLHGEFWSGQVRRINRALEATIDESAVDLQAGVIQHASGRPGPEIDTGEYIDSIKIGDLTKEDGHYSRPVYTDAPQGHRLEYGFIGQDSLGRVYNQPPYPHWRPARREMRKKIAKKMLKKLKESR